LGHPQIKAGAVVARAAASAKMKMGTFGGRSVMHRLGFPVFIEVVYKRLQEVLPGFGLPLGL
jgi:hypothetical protein